MAFTEFPQLSFTVCTWILDSRYRESGTSFIFRWSPRAPELRNIHSVLLFTDSTPPKYEKKYRTPQMSRMSIKLTFEHRWRRFRLDYFVHIAERKVFSILHSRTYVCIYSTAMRHCRPSRLWGLYTATSNDDRPASPEIDNRFSRERCPSTRRASKNKDQASCTT